MRKEFTKDIDAFPFEIYNENMEDIANMDRRSYIVWASGDHTLVP